MEYTDNLKVLFNTITHNLKDKELKDLFDFVIDYNGTDWKKHIVISNNYYKKKIYSNELAEMFIITWNINAESKVHDHPDEGCILKVLKGKLKEEIYENREDKIEYISEQILKYNDVGFQISNKYLHKIKNINKDYTVSLHIYSPPNFKIKYY